ncbi:polycomb group protein Psc [Nasonia vitripennis]|uniref:RING-type domain-containing protein n=1 Tax=Nasonia vitripennis TaxID=7425 RepID=A0A7M7G303_NASVI|nr:polycomb group protein Psc [Nasonia vitripennis]
MSGQSGGRLHLSTLNEQLTCKLCGGYFIDATTIIECLHSFCKSCIVKYLESNKFCPVCDAQVHKNKPLSNIRPDQTLQDIVYKLVPGCYQNEMRCRKEFYAKHPEEKNSVTSPEARGEPVESYIYSPDESLSLSLEYYSPEAAEETENDKEAASKHLPRRYLRCPAAVTVFHLQKLIRAKYGLSEAHRVDIMYKEAPLCATYTLMDIMYIYHWRRKVPLHLSYRIFESASKRIKLSEDNDEFKQSLSNSNMELESKDNEQSIKREWKEVQLKISETGVMSVMDISSLDSKKSTKINEINQQSGLDQAASNSYNVNKTVMKTEEKEAVKSCATSSKSKKVQQDSSAKKSEQAHEEKSSNVSLSAISASQNNSKSEEMEVKSIDQRDLSNELMKADNVKNDNSSKTPNDSAQTPSTGDKSQAQKAQQLLEKIKTEPVSTADKRSEGKQNLTNNNSINNENKAEANAKPNAKSNDAKGSPSAGSKINALSAKLQFQPKVGQVNNTYSKKSSVADKKATSTSPVKTTDTKPPKTTIKSEAKPSEGSSNTPVTELNASKVAVTSVSCSGVSIASSLTSGSSVAATYVTAPSTSIDTCATSVKLQQQHNNALQTVAAPSTESLASIGLHVSTTMPSQVNLNSWMAERSKNSSGKTAMSPDIQLRSMPGMPQIGKDIVCSTTASSPSSSMGRFNIQTPSMSIYSISTTMKNNVYTSATQNYSNSPSKQAMTKPGFGTSNMYPQVPPCPAAIPISLMKPAKTSKGTTLNEICAKISNASSSGSKINDICAKIGESSKEKSKIDAMQQQLQRNKPEVPDLLKISKKTMMTPVNESIHGSGKHIPNIPNVPIYTPSNSQALHASNEAAKDSVKRLATALVSSQAALMTPQMQKMSQKKHSQAVGYKTLRDPPKSWNPTLSKNNYVAAKNQAKEMQNQAQAAYGMNDGSGTASKQPASKQAKIFKIRNMPRYLGNPASGVKPMYGVVNEQSKDKDQSTSTKNNSPTMSMMKIDPQTLSPIVSSPNNSPIVSPPPYSPTARSYQNSPFTPRDICRNSNSPISPRNSPVNMLSTNPFIPSQTHNTNPRLIYSHFPPTFTDASRFSNPLIRSPIGISPPSAFHSSMPPSINKFYQRSGYMTQPQTSVAVAAAAAAAAATASFSSGVTAQQQQQHAPAVQRIPPSSHSSPVPTASSPSASSPSSASSKSPKTSSASPSGAGATNVKLTTTTTTSTTSTSVVDSVALQLAKGLAQRDSKIYDLTRTDSPKPSSDNTGATNQNASVLLQSAQIAKKSSEISNKAKSSPSVEVQKTSGETSTKHNDLDATNKSSQQEAKIAISTAATVTTTAVTTTVTKELDKDEKSHAKVNGGITITMTNNDKPKVDAAGQEKQEKVEKPTEDKSSVVDAATESEKSNSAASPSKSAPGKTVAQEAPQEKIETKQSVTAPQQKLQNTEGGKTGDAATTLQGKKIVADAQKEKAES